MTLQQIDISTRVIGQKSGSSSGGGTRRRTGSPLSLFLAGDDVYKSVMTSSFFSSFVYMWDINAYARRMRVAY